MPKRRANRSPRKSRSGPGRAGRGRSPASLAEERLYRTALGTIKEAAAMGDPLRLEMMASEFLGLASQAGPPGEGADLAIAEMLVRRASRGRSPEALMLLVAFAAVGPPELADRAADAARRLAAAGVPKPPWAEGVGRDSFVEAWRVTHPLGDQEVVLSVFRHPAATPHLISVLVDRNLGWMAKDIGVSDRPEEVLRGWRSQEEFSVEAIEAAEASGRVLQALAITDTYLDPPVSDDYPAQRALARARMRALPATWIPEAEPELSEEERAALVEDFLASPEARRSRRGEEVLRDAARTAIDYMCDQGAGDPLRWNPVAVELFLVDWCPRKVVLEDDVADALPGVLRAWIRYAGRRVGLADHLTKETLDNVDGFEAEYREAVRDPSTFGPAKALLVAMRAEGVDPTDAAAMERWIEEFNARPFEERARILPGP